MSTKNIDIAIDSAYRSLDRQQELYQEFCTKYGKEYASSIVAPVGASEHHTGLAIDLTIKTKTGFLTENVDREKYHQTYQQFIRYFLNLGLFFVTLKEKKKLLVIRMSRGIFVMLAILLLQLLQKIIIL